MTTTEPAYESDELDLTEQERESARHLAASGGKPVTFDKLLQSLGRSGQDPALLDVALTLPLDQYERFRDCYNAADKPKRRARR